MKPGTLVAAVACLSLAGAYAWNRSNLGGDYWAQQEAKRQCEAVRALGVYCDQAQAPRPKKRKTDSCDGEVALVRGVAS